MKLRNLPRYSAGVCIGLAGLCVLLAQAPDRPVTVGKEIPHLVLGPENQKRKFQVFSWEEFLAMNWPALKGSGGLPVRGAADPDKKPGDPGMRVWETWKADYELFPDQAHAAVTPTAWSSWDLPEPVCSSENGFERVIPMVAKGESVFPGGLNQAMGGPLVDQHHKYVRYEVRVNETEYNETRDKLWYLRKNLSRNPKTPNLFTSSTADTYGAMELKAAWRIMTPEETAAQPPRYYMTQARVVDVKTHKCSPETVAVGLVGFHIAHKTGIFKAWVWSTFEQVDNVPDPSRAAPALGYSLSDGKTPPGEEDEKSLTDWGFSPASGYRPVPSEGLQPENSKLAAVNVRRLNPISNVSTNDIVKLNGEVHNLEGVKGTVWENYELVDTQWQQKSFDRIEINPTNTTKDFYSTLDATPADAVANVTMETFYQGLKGDKPSLARNKLGITNLGSSCLHCHYQAAQYDFSWVLADAAWPSSPASASKTTKASAAKDK